MNLPPARLEPLNFEALPGWAEADPARALASFRRSAAEMLQTGRGFSRRTEYAGEPGDWEELCRKALNWPDQAARDFFETGFDPLLVSNQAHFTGYYEAEALGSLEPSAQFPVPIYRKPDDPNLQSLTRPEIEVRGGLAGKGLELVWLSSWVDAFFIHIQGSGRVHLPDGRILRLAFAGKNGAPYVSIGKLLIEARRMTLENMSMQSLRLWLSENPDEGLGLLRQNPSFIYFRQAPITDPELGPPGAQQVQLTPWASLAMDRAFWAFGTPIFVETPLPGGVTLRDLLIAQDTGSAIKGASRADIFCGAGDAAAFTAGHLNSSGRLTVLLPKKLAARLKALS
jgi:membrane-bound lytic murein transglycosylase A